MVSETRTGDTDHQSEASTGVGDAQHRLSLEHLTARNVELQEELEARTRENIFLNEMISTVGSTLKVDEVLRHLVDTIVRAISCHAAFIYLYEKERERLVLASSSKQYHHLLGKIELA